MTNPDGVNRRLEYLQAQREQMVAGADDGEDVETLDQAIAEAKGESLLGDGSPRP